MRRECFPSHRLRRKPLVSDHGMHHGTCVTHVPWWMSGSLTSDGGENVPDIPGIPGAYTTRNFAYLAKGPWTDVGRIGQTKLSYLNFNKQQLRVLNFTVWIMLLIYRKLNTLGKVWQNRDCWCPASLHRQIIGMVVQGKHTNVYQPSKIRHPHCFRWGISQNPNINFCFIKGNQHSKGYDVPTKLA